MSAYTDTRNGNAVEPIMKHGLSENLCTNPKNLNDKVNELEKKLDSIIIIKRPCKNDIHEVFCIGHIEVENSSE